MHENYMHLNGTISSDPVFNHTNYGEAFFSATLDVPRTSGAIDKLPIMLPERLMDNSNLTVGSKLHISGQIRTYDKIDESGNHLMVTAFARDFLDTNSNENPNQVQISGVVCMPPKYRVTPFGREIADLMLAVNRAYGKSDYIPCITWGRTARFASHLKVGDQLTLMGRFQSRGYQKLVDGAVVDKMAYEVSVARLYHEREVKDVV